jgi:hypothetical protein
MPTATFTHTARTAASPAAVWAALQQAATWRGLGVMDSVSGEVVSQGSLVSFDWTAAVGATRHQGTARVTAAEPGARMVLALRATEVEGELEVVLRQGGDGGSGKPTAPTTILDVTLTARPRGLLGSMFWGKISQALGRGLPARVEEFAAGF